MLIKSTLSILKQRMVLKSFVIPSRRTNKPEEWSTIRQEPEAPCNNATSRDLLRIPPRLEKWVIPNRGIDTDRSKSTFSGWKLSSISGKVRRCYRYQK